MPLVNFIVVVFQHKLSASLMFPFEYDLLKEMSRTMNQDKQRSPRHSHKKRGTKRCLKEKKMVL